MMPLDGKRKRAYSQISDVLSSTVNLVHSYVTKSIIFVQKDRSAFPNAVRARLEPSLT